MRWSFAGAPGRSEIHALTQKRAQGCRFSRAWSASSRAGFAGTLVASLMLSPPASVA
jgi:hypothetical protein